MRKVLLYGLLIISILIVGIIYFLDFLKTPVLFGLDAKLVNKFLETLSFAYITSFIFYGIVVILKKNEDRVKIYEILEEPFTVYVNQLCTVYKTKNPPRTSISVEELLLNQIPDIINQKNDLYSVSNGTNFVQKPLQLSWIEWLKKINDRLLADTNDVFYKYSNFLETETGASYEKLKISNYSRLVDSANVTRIDNLSSLGLDEKFKVHHKFFLTIFKKVFKNYHTEIVYDNDRFSLRCS